MNIIGLKALFSRVACTMAAMVAIPAAAGAAEITVTVRNLTHGIYFTPLLVTAHDGETHLFQAGTAASEALRAMAEGGDISGLSEQVGGPDEDTVENPAGGLLGPGQSATLSLNTDDTGHGWLSLAAMLLPTNDGFVGLDALAIPTAPGTYRYTLNGYDSGTEVNDELITGGGAPGVPGIPAAPGGDGGVNGTGLASDEVNTTVHIHRGTLGDMDPTGGPSDLDSRIHRWQNPVAKVMIEVF